MRVVLQPREESKGYSENPPIFRFPFHYMEESQTIHITETDMIEQIFNSMGNDVVVLYNDGSTDIVEDYKVCSIEQMN